MRRECGWRVLVVDADRELEDRVLSNAQRCEREVTDVWAARTGADAIILARELRPDLLLLDPDLPDVDGWALLQRILEDVRGCAAVIVARHAKPEDIMLALACGARGYLVKPITNRDTLPKPSGCVVSAVDILSDLLAPAPAPAPSGPQDESFAKGQ